MTRLLRRARGVTESGVVGTAGVVGTSLGLVFAVTAVLRRSKPLHPVGAVAPAVLVVDPGSTPSGSPVLDEAGVRDCLVRASYAAGLGPQLPDVEGLALRVLACDTDAGVADLLFAGTGVGPLTRHVLAVRRPGRHASQTTLLPVRAGGRPFVVRLEPLDPDTQPWPSRYRLSWAHGRGDWHPCGTLTVQWGAAGDAPERFDSVAHPLPGTSQYAVVARLREPAYRWSRLAWPRAGRLSGHRDDDPAQLAERIVPDLTG